MSVVLKVKICEISIAIVMHIANNIVFFIALYFFHNIGNKKPNGTNKRTFKQAFTKSEIISTNGMILIVKSKFKDNTLAEEKPTGHSLVHFGPGLALEHPAALERL